MDQDAARALAVAVVNELWERSHSGVLGTKLKIELNRQAHARGDVFDERELGYPSFSAFLESLPGLTLHRRPGTDVLVSPEGRESDSPPQHGAGRIRPDFWRAFVGFPIPGEVRGYSPGSDRIVIARDQDGLPDDAVPITPTPKERQIEWRREFLRSLDSGNPISRLAETLSVEGGFVQFARVLAASPLLRPEWNAAWLAHVSDEIGAWAADKGIPRDIWLETSNRSAEPRSDARRSQLLDVIRRIPTEYLEQIEIKIGWLVDPPKDDR